MAKKKTTAGKSAPQKTTMIKIAEKVGEIAGKIVNEKDHLAEMAGNAIESAKEKINGITGSKKSSAKKTVKAVVKKAAKKIVKPAPKKITKAVAKKVAPAKKAIKKLVKKAAKKISGKK